MCIKSVRSQKMAHGLIEGTTHVNIEIYILFTQR